MEGMKKERSNVESEDREKRRDGGKIGRGEVKLGERKRERERDGEGGREEAEGGRGIAEAGRGRDESKSEEREGGE